MALGEIIIEITIIETGVEVETITETDTETIIGQLQGWL